MQPPRSIAKRLRVTQGSHVYGTGASATRHIVFGSVPVRDGAVPTIENLAFYKTRDNSYSVEPVSMTVDGSEPYAVGWAMRRRVTVPMMVAIFATDRYGPARAFNRSASYPETVNGSAVADFAALQAALDLQRSSRDVDGKLVAEAADTNTITTQTGVDWFDIADDFLDEMHLLGYVGGADVSSSRTVFKAPHAADYLVFLPIVSEARQSLWTQFSTNTNPLGDLYVDLGDPNDYTKMDAAMQDAATTFASRPVVPADVECVVTCNIQEDAPR